MVILILYLNKDFDLDLITLVCYYEISKTFHRCMFISQSLVF